MNIPSLHTRPINNNAPVNQEVIEINTVIKPEKDEVQCSSTNQIYQNIQKELPKQNWILIGSVDILIDSGAESNIINIPTWNGIKTIHPTLIPIKTASKLATAQGSTLINYGKIQLFLVPTRTMEQNKIINKPFKQTFHITDRKHNIIGIPVITN